jgi:hypothetical protein
MGTDGNILKTRALDYMLPVADDEGRKVSN